MYVYIYHETNICILACSDPFAGLYPGAKACGAKPGKMPRKNFCKKKLVPGALQKFELGLPYSRQPAPGFLAPPPAIL